MEQIEILSLPLSDEEIPKIELDREKLVETLESMSKLNNIEKIKTDINEVMTKIENDPDDNPWSINIPSANGRAWCGDREVFISNLRQIYETKTIERIIYYIERLIKSFTRVRTGKINDINLNRWKEYKEIRTESIWVDKKRDKLALNKAGYWGNFIPQIPRQMMLRYSQARDYVLDTFAGSGTTLMECRRLGRNGIGLELNPVVARKAQFEVDHEENPFDVKTNIVAANSVTADYAEILKEQGIKKIQLAIMHPPYYDIIRFSENKDDLSNAKDVGDFLDRMEEIGRRTREVLERGRFACLVIGDKYQQGEWVPLGFWTMDRMMKIGFRLKSIVIKNFDQTKGKRSQEELWRYRALVGGFYVFKHEYIYLFQRE